MSTTLVPTPAALPLAPADFWLPLLLAVETFLILSNLHQYIYTLGWLRTSFIYAGLIAANALVAIGHGRLGNVYAGLAAYRWPLVGLLAILLSWALRFIFQGDAEAATQRLITLTEFLILIGSFAAVCGCTGRGAAPAIRLAALAALVCGSVTICVEISQPFSGRLSSVYGRAAGWYVNPNIAGAALVLMTALLVPRLRSLALRILVVSLSGLAIVATFSREALLAQFLLILQLSWRGDLLPLRNVFLRTSAAALLFVMLPPLFFGFYSSHVRWFSDELGVPAEVAARVDRNFVSQMDDSARYRRFVAAEAAKIFVEDPIWGGGIGVADRIGAARQGPHNMYLVAAAETGLVGLLMFVGWLAALWLRGNPAGRPVVLVYAVLAVFSHNNLDQLTLLLPLALGTARLPSAAAESV